MGKEIVYLQISTWSGISLGARHYYGELICDGKSVDLLHRLSAREAAKLNKSHDWKLWKGGDRYSGFETAEELVELALKTYLEYFPQALVLIRGHSYCADPQPVLVGPDKDKLNELCEQCEQLGWWDCGRREQVQNLCDEWDCLLERAVNERGRG